MRLNPHKKKDGQTDELPTTNAIGQNIRLTASDGSTTDKFRLVWQLVEIRQLSVHI